MSGLRFGFRVQEALGLYRALYLDPNSLALQGQGVLMYRPFDPSLDRREHPWFYPVPVPSRSEPKAESSDEVIEFEGSD